MKACIATVAILLFQVAGAQQMADPDFKPTVAIPAYSQGQGPTVAIDEAHGNFHTATGRYKPFADLLTSDGYKVVASTGTFEADVLKALDILVIANAQAGQTADPAFTERESENVATWIRSGGALLLIADHAPFGAAAANLGRRFGVEMGKGWVFQPSGDTITAAS